MPGMYELPPLPLDGSSEEMADREPALRVRHAITNTNYYVRIYSPKGEQDKALLLRSVPLAKADLHWLKTATLGGVPLTGLTRKVLQRLNVMAVEPLRGPEPEGELRRARNATREIVDRDEDHDEF